MRCQNLVSERVQYNIHIIDQLLKLQLDKILTDIDIFNQYV